MEKLIDLEEVELMQSKVTKSTIVQAFNTSLSPHYDSDYVLVTKEFTKGSEKMFAFCNDVTDLFYFYDLVK